MHCRFSEDEVSWPRSECFHSVSAVNSVSHLNMKARLFITITTISIGRVESIGTSRHNHRLFKYPIKVLRGLRDGVKKNVTFLVNWSFWERSPQSTFFSYHQETVRYDLPPLVSIIMCFKAFLDVSSKKYGSKISPKKGGNKPPSFPLFRT